jgi:regulator of replication initiation timing
MRTELAQATVIADQAKSTWELLRKERDFHKTHQDRVNGEKVTISNNIKKIKEMLEQYEERIEEIKKKLQSTVKEKALLKLEKEKIQKKVNDVQTRIKATEERASKEFEENARKQAAARARDASPKKGQNTPYPQDDARPNPWLARSYDDCNPRMQPVKKIDAHKKGVAGMGLHWRKNIVATTSDDCSWKIWNLDNGENIMTGEGHREWICSADFHPLGSHLVTSGGDKSIKLWDFVSAGISHTFADVHTGPIWRTKFHDSGDFVLSAGGDGAIKLFDLNALK